MSDTQENFISSTVHSQEWLCDLVSTSGVFDWLTGWDIYDEYFYENVQEHISAKAALFWEVISKDFPVTKYDPALVFENLLALADGIPALEAFLLRFGSVVEVSITDDARRYQWQKNFSEIQNRILGQVSSESWLPFLAGISNNFAQLEPSNHSDALKLRYRLVSLWRGHGTLIDALHLRLNFDKLSLLFFRRELKRSIYTAASNNRPWAKLSLSQYRRLKISAKLVIGLEPELISIVLREDVANSQVFVETQEAVLREHAWSSKIEKAALRFVKAVCAGYFSEANALVDQVDLGLLRKEILVRLRKRIAKINCIQSIPVHPNAIPLTPEAYKLFQSLVSPRKVPIWLTLDPALIISSLLEGRINPRDIPENVLENLEKKWTGVQIWQLLHAGHLALLYARGLAQSVDESQLWRSEKIQRLMLRAVEIAGGVHRILEYIETNEAVALADFLKNYSNRLLDGPEADILLQRYGKHPQLIDDTKPPIVRRLVNYWLSQGEMISQAAYSHTLVAAIAKGISQVSNEQSRQWGEVANRLCHEDDTFCSQIINQVDSDALVASLGDVSKSSEWLSSNAKLRNDYPELLFKSLFFSQENHSKITELLFQFVRDYPDHLELFNQDIFDLLPPLESTNDLTLHLLCLRRSPRKIKKLSSEFNQEIFRNSCLAAAQTIGLSRQESAYLGVLAYVGPRWSRSLAGALSQCRHAASSGSKLDHLYKTYELPKKAGGNRKINAPPQWLKSLQRQIMETIILPLGQHDAAYGFVRQRSIVDNATVHVNKPVVAHCDIHSCFPSVRWQLVLGVLRRDLQGKLPGPAISFLVDITCFGGALPIGAPTSPSLLNRVLVKTDELLTIAAAEKGCDYTRYADDITFSGGDSAPGLIAYTRKLLNNLNLELDEKKTQIYRRGRRQIVTGLVVNQQVSIPRRVRRRLRAAAHSATLGKQAYWHDKPVSDASLLGRLGYIRLVHPAEGERLITQVQKSE